MIGYNLYYNGKRINTRELTEEQVDKIQSRSHIYKVDKENNKKLIILKNLQVRVNSVSFYLKTIGSWRC